ncbi:MAG: hypothetical protein R8J94_04805 [Acidimicrobiia bacterium]|nr:hypothetical protein [Acidimicrobiia bacterium]
MSKAGIFVDIEFVKAVAAPDSMRNEGNEEAAGLQVLRGGTNGRLVATSVCSCASPTPSMCGTLNRAQR